jgi:uncharacterized membrane protein
MKTRLINFAEKLHSTYWFVPTLMLVLTVGLFVGMISIDQRYAGESIKILGWIYTGGAEGARTVLSTIASSMINVAGVTFSITMVVLALASSQFGPRLLSNFMRDTVNQVVLGTFISTFLYCLLVLRTIRGLEDDVFVPNFSVSVGVLLALASIGVLVYFIHHVAESIQADQILARISNELEESIDKLYPDRLETVIIEKELIEPEDIPENFDSESAEIEAGRSGYIQAIDYDGLMQTAKEYDLILDIYFRPGDFVSQGNALASAWPEERLEEDITEEISGAFILGPQRIRTQDIEYFINQLVEIAVRALSPGINDPFTAMASVDRLTAALVQLAKKREPPAFRYDEDRQLRLISDPVTFEGVLDAAFNQIRQAARDNTAVTIRLLEALAIIAAHVVEDREKESLLRQAEMIHRRSREAVPEAEDRRDVNRRYQTLRELLDQDPEKAGEAPKKTNYRNQVSHSGARS